MVEVKEASKQLAVVLEASQLAERDVPDYIEVDHTKMTAKFVRIPALSDVPFRCRWNRIWSSNSIRADFISGVYEDRRPRFCRGLFVWV